MRINEAIYTLLISKKHKYMYTHLLDVPEMESIIKHLKLIAQL